MSVLRTGRGRAGGGGGVEYLTEHFFFAKKCSWGLKKFFFPTKIFFSKMFLGLFFGGGDFGVFGAYPGVARGQKTITLLPMTMTCDRLKFWSSPAWRSKVIIRRPWRRKNKK